MGKKPIFLRFRSCNLYVLVTVSVSLFTDMMVYSIIIPIMPFIIDSIQNGKSLDTPNTIDTSYSIISNGEIASKNTGILLALFSAGLLIGSPVLGYLADRMKHRQWLMVVGIVGLLGATILFLLATAYWELLLARFLQGFSDACVWTLGLCLIADTFPLEQLGAQMGKVLTFHSLGLVAGSPIGALYKAGGYKAPFILCIVLAGIDLILRLFLVERRHRPAEWFEKDENSTSTIVPSVIIADISEEKERKNVSTLQLLRQHRLLAGILLGFCNGIIVNVLEPTLTVRLATEWGYDSSQIGLMLLSFVVPTLIANPIAGIMSDKFGAKVVCCTNLILCAITIFITGIPNKSTTGGVVPLIVILSFQGFTAAAFLTPALSEMSYVVQLQNPDGGDSGQCMSYALFNIAFALGGTVGPLFGGYLYSSVGFFYMCIILGCFTLLCVPYAYIHTGGRGKFIVRPQNQDHRKNCVNEENVNSTQNNNTIQQKLN